MDLFLPGGNRVRLGRDQFLGRGGQGDVYVAGPTAFKVYHDPSQTLPAAKLQELAVLQNPHIIRPEQLVADASGKTVGYSMRRVEGGMPLCQLFTRAFRDANHISPPMVLELVQQFQAGISYIHGQGILLVDIHELNFLVAAGFSTLWFIDADSYQTPGFPASAICETVRDRHSSRFHEGSDWFSFAVTSFQLLTGIHPYRGKHPTVNSLDARMQQNLSVFQPGVVLPPTCYPLGSLPSAYREWFRAVFEKGVRTPPPDQLQAQAKPASVPVRNGSAPLSMGVLRLEQVAEFPSAIIRPLFLMGQIGAITAAGLVVEGATWQVGPDAHAGWTVREQAPAAAWIESGRLRVRDLQRGVLASELVDAEQVTSSGARIVVKLGDALHDVVLLSLPGGMRISLKRAANVLPHATRVFQGVAVQDLLGARNVTLLPEGGGCHTLRAPELDGSRVVDARFERGLLLVLTQRQGAYRRLAFACRQDSGGTRLCCEMRDAREVQQPELNSCVLVNGLCVLLNESGELELSSLRSSGVGTRTVDGAAAAGGYLYSDGAAVYLARNRTLYRLRLSGA